MPPTASKKGSKSGAAREQRSTSRHSTPVSALTETTAPPTPVMATPITVATMPRETAYLHTSTAAIISQDPSIETMIDGKSSSKPGDPPSSRDLHALHDRIRDSVNKFMSKRSEICDRSLRQLMQKRKERIQADQEEEIARQQDEVARIKREDEDTERKKTRKPSRKRSHDEMEIDQDEDKKKEGLPSIGVHGLARQDGIAVHEGIQAPPSPPIQQGTVAIDPLDVVPSSPSDSEESRKDPPSMIPLYERIYGSDPAKFDDPTVYDIRPLTDDMSDDDKREIMNVLHWPESDLRHLTAGDPPDQDFSNAKPANQINFSTFQTAIEPYIRLLTEEDVATLKERGDRLTPYVIPALGSKGYKDVWAAEEGVTGIEPPAVTHPSANEARGSMEDMDDNVAETDEVSMGPVMSRLLSIIRPAPNSTRREDEAIDAYGDVSMTNGDAEIDSSILAGAIEDSQQQKPLTCLPPDAPRPANLPSLDYDAFDQRMLQELRYIGILGTNDMPDYDAQNDDEVCARLRTLQHELRTVAATNNARKLRVLELTDERMAMQEYANIADDLDNQVNAAYLKRNRSLAKPSNKKSAQQRAGQKGVAGVATGRGVSDGVRALMQKRRDWVDMVGPVVEYGKPRIPEEDETIFGEEDMKRLREAEMEAEIAEADVE